MPRLSEEIVALLGVSTAPMSQFDEWVCERTVRVCSSAANGPPALRLELAHLRRELRELERVAPMPLWQSEALWLEGLIELVGAVASVGSGDVVVDACA